MWTEPKTDWTPSDGVADDDFNRIEGNTLDNHDRLDLLDLLIENYQRKVRIGGIA